MTHANHRAKTITRTTKALTLVPATIASAAATAAVLTSTGATAVVPTLVAKNPPLPSVTVPSQPIETQATVSRPDRIAPAVPKNAGSTIVAASFTNGIPTVALNAYQRAAEVINASDPGCNMPWELIAGIGRVESDHGQFGGSHLNAQGEAVPPIYGPLLDGKNGIALIRDTDGGALDGNAQYDRAVGPMQFLPSTWQALAVDGNGDGKRDPQNIYDASLGTAIYLCSGQRNMATEAGRQAAVFSYNHSTDYVKLVLAIMQAYEAGNYSSIPAGAYAAAAPKSKTALPKKHTKSRKTGSQPSQAPTTTAPSGSPTPTPSPSPSPSNVDPITGLINGLSGKKTSTPSPSPSPSKMSSAQAASYCASKLPFGFLNPLFSACSKKVTGLTPAQADTGWAAHTANLAAWFNS